MVKFSIGFIALLVSLFISNYLTVKHQPVSHPKNALAMAAEPDSIEPVTPASSQVADALEQSFCAPQICGEAGWQQWIIVTPGDSWQTDELILLRDILTTVIDALDQQGLDGRSLLSGYRFQRQQGEYIIGHPGRVAVVNHTTQEITLADASFKRLRGFYIFHELGHVIDWRTERQLSTAFHIMVGSDQTQSATADGYWLNQAAEHDLEEAVADAFALWIMSNYGGDYRPVFAHTPVTTDYEGITRTFSTSLKQMALPQ
ncbi:MAG: hypothetical protein CL608_25365 [Anaerolineaceae bacterium]|nr:hypothetical protein [Anaerolineaceae bacterium]